MPDNDIKKAHKEAYEREVAEIEKNCEGCTMRSPERCDWCTHGRRRRLVEAKYADVTGWSHGKW